MTLARTRRAGPIFFASGFAALTYQVVWQRALFAIFGINVEAVTVVVAGFLTGLGFGSLLGGRLSRIPGLNLLKLFGLLELGIGLFGLASLSIFHWAGRQTLHQPESVVTATVLILLFLPTLPMGATLPILAQYLVRQNRTTGDSVGLLYCVNTFGSAAACFAAMLGLMRAFGMYGVVMLAACVNFSVAGSALWMARRSAGLDVSPVTPPPAGRLSPRQPLLLAMLAGYLALSWEMVWFRGFLIHNDRATAFTLILGTYLAGLALGSYWSRGVRAGAAARDRLGLLLLGSAVLGFLVLPAAARAAQQDWFATAMVLLVLAQAAVSGGVFPLLCEIGVAADDRAGAGLSLLYTANIVGSVLGTLVTGLFLMDWLSTAALNTLLGLAGVAVAAVFARNLALAGGFTAIAIAAGAFGGYWFDHFHERAIFGPGWRLRAPFVATVENRHGVINVDSAGTVYGGGLYDGMVRIDLINDPNLLFRPLSLPLFHPDPREVLMVGLSTGAWAQVLAGNPAIQRMTVVEINPGYLQLIREYPQVASLLSNPKVEIVIDDGRRWMNRHPGRRFDAIVQNTTWNYRSHATNLLSEEYVRLSAAHLKPGGVLLYNTTGSDRALRTGCTLLPTGFREWNLFVGGTSAIQPDYARLRDALVRHQLDGRPAFDLSNPLHCARIDRILSSVAGSLESCEEVRKRTPGLPTITDNNMGEEWKLGGIYAGYDRLLTKIAAIGEDGN